MISNKSARQPVWKSESHPIKLRGIQYPYQYQYQYILPYHTHTQIDLAKGSGVRNRQHHTQSLNQEPTKRQTTTINEQPFTSYHLPFTIIRRTRARANNLPDARPLLQEPRGRVLTNSLSITDSPPPTQRLWLRSLLI